MDLDTVIRPNKADKLAFVSDEPYEYRRCPVHQTKEPYEYRRCPVHQTKEHYEYKRCPVHQTKVGKLSSVPTIYPVELDIVLRQNQPGKLTPAPEVPYEYRLCLVHQTKVGKLSSVPEISCGI